MRIEVNIGELNLHGVPAAQRHRMGDRVKAELARMLQEGKVASAADRGPLAPPERQIASAIYREIRRML